MGGFTGRCIHKSSQIEIVFKSKNSYAANFSEALKGYNPEEQQYLKRFNDLTHGLLDFSSPEDQQWKVVRGYPTIEEILANRGKPVPLDGKFYREAPLKEAVMGR